MVLLIGRINGVATLLKKEIPTLFTIPCIIHRKLLIAKILYSNLFDLHERIFKSLFEDYNEDYDKLLLHSSKMALQRKIFNPFS